MESGRPEGGLPAFRWISMGERHAPAVSNVFWRLAAPCHSKVTPMRANMTEAVDLAWNSAVAGAAARLLMRTGMVQVWAATGSVSTANSVAIVLIFPSAR